MVEQDDEFLDISTAARRPGATAVATSRAK
jgi:hypothetical protein